MYSQHSNIFREYFKNFDFPEDIINKDISESERNVLFEMSNHNLKENSISHKNKNKDILNDKNDFSKSFYKQTEDEKYHNYNNYRKNNNSYSKNQNQFFNKNEWKPNKNYNNNNFINANKNHNVIDYIKDMEMTKVDDFSLHKNLNNIKNKNRKNLKNDSMANMFDTNYDYIENNENLKEQNFYNKNNIVFTNEINNELNQIPTSTYQNQNPIFNKKNNSTFTSMNIKLIYKINKDLNFPKEDPLWYVYHTGAKSSFGPVSSLHLEELYNSKHLDGASDVRMIDIFKLKSKGPFAYFKLKDLECDNFLNDFVEPSNLIKYVDDLNNIKNEKSCVKNSAKNENLKNTINNEEIVDKYTKETLSKYNKKKEKIIYYDELYDDVDPSLFRKGEIIINNNEKENKKNEINNQTEKINLNNNINNNLNNKTSSNTNKNTPNIVKNIVKNKISLNIKNDVHSVIDDELKIKFDEKEKEKEKEKDKIYPNYTNIINTNSNVINKNKGGKKKSKGKPVDLDIKTGFYTLSHQEKNYEPIYICGDLEN